MERNGRAVVDRDYRLNLTMIASRLAAPRTQQNTNDCNDKSFTMLQYNSHANGSNRQNTSS